MAQYKLDGKKKVEYENLVQYGIGYNIPYAKGTFEVDKKGKLTPVPEKFKRLYKDVMSKYIPFITIEGGKRGGKDVYGLWCWANFLMSTPDQQHIVTGQTINHAISTVLKADGFGIEYLLPHGEKVMVDNNPVYRFIDWYGVVKEIKFFAGGEVNDLEKFRGMSFGSAYCNEAIKQHINTIKECKDRTMASKWRKIIHTQNPLAGSFGYYDEYEKPLIVNMVEIPSIMEMQEKYKQNVFKIESTLQANFRKVRSVIEKKYCESFGVSSIHDIENNPILYERVNLNVRNKCIEVEKQVYAKLGLDPSCFHFVEYYPNPNGIKNGKYFRYYHFDMYDNLSMTDTDRQTIIETSDTTSVQYRRDILGLRASADNAIYDTFTDKNIVEGEIPYLYSGDRYLCVDYGMKNDFVVLDCEVNNDFSCTVWKEFRFNGRAVAESQGEGNYIPPTNAKYAEYIMNMIQERNNGDYIMVIIDPSATGLINEMVINGIAYKKAKNDVGVKPKDHPDKKVDKTLTGIWLVRDGFAKGKIKVHESCRELINEIYGYALDPKKLLIGIEEPLKVRDHGCIVGESKIKLFNGLEKEIKDIVVGDKLLTMNENTKQIEIDEVEDVSLTQHNADVYELELENGMKIELTADHKVFTQNGRKAVQELTEDDKIITFENEIKYIDDVAYVDGLKFKKDAHTNYFLSTSRIGKTRKRLHRYMWEKYNGSIPKGYEIHHIDFDKNNNEIYNLKLVSNKEHRDIHAKALTKEQKEKYIINLLKNAVPKAKDWHKSKEGSEWHSKHASEQMKNRKYKQFNCLNCGKEFFSKAIQGAKFCCNNCKASYRRKNERNKNKIN